MRRKILPRDRVPAGVSEQERQILDGLASLREETAREVMTPRVDVVALKAPVSFEDAVRAVRRTGHSHFPVYEGDLDHLVGVLFVKDLFRDGPPRCRRPAVERRWCGSDAGARAGLGVCRR